MSYALESQDKAARLNAEDVHVWWCSTDVLAKPGVRDACHALMNAEERERHDRFMVERVRDEFLVTRGLCRSVLSYYANVEPRAWQFVPNEYGRPAIAAPQLPHTLHFNLSNTQGLVAIAVTRLAYEVGVDVEDTGRRCDVLSLAEHSFSASEAAHVKTLSGYARTQAFFTFWTMKEAYIKARGMGLSIPLDQFAIVPNSTPLQITFTNEIADTGPAWQLELRNPTPHHLMALAIKRGPRPNVQVHVREGLPL